MDGAGSHVPSGRRFNVGDRVEVVGEPGVYLVVRVDRRRCAADLMLMGRNARMEFGVHFAAMRPAYDRHVSQGRPRPFTFAIEGAEAMGD